MMMGEGMDKETAEKYTKVAKDGMKMQSTIGKLSKEE
jgi:hypothetical protein